MKISKPQNFFDLNIKILKGGGIYPPQTSSKIKTRLIWTFNTICVCYSIIYFTIAELAALKQSSSNIYDLVKNLNMSMSFILTFFKVTVWFNNYRELSHTMHILQVTAGRFTKIGDDFDPEKIIATERRVKDRLLFTFFTLAFLVPTSACLLTLVDVFSASAHAHELAELKLPYLSFVPFDYTQSVAGFCAAVVYQCMALLSCGMITVGFDMLFYSLVCFTSTHFKLLQGGFAKIKEKAEMNLVKCNTTGGMLQDKMYDELRGLIKHLQQTLRICEQLERIFSNLILLQTIVSLVVFCTCLFIISTIPLGSKIPGNEITYMLAIENQLALYCYAGNKLTTRAAEIPNAIYSSDWLITTNTKYRRNIIFTMMRMSKPIYLTAGKFTAMTLATFVTIGRGSYSLFAVLNSSQ